MTRSRVLSSVFTLLLTAYWCCSAASDEVRGGAPQGNLPSVSGAPGFGSIPHGIARPFRRATMSAPLQGMLVKVLIKSGDQVKKGQVLAMMNNRIATAAVNAAQAAAHRTAEIDHAKHALALARSLFARQNSLKDSQAGAAYELEEARSRRDQAQATLASALEVQIQAKRNLELEQARLEAHSIRAPFDGQVVRIDATVGSTLTPTDKLLTIISLDSLEAELYLPLKLFGKLQAGQSYRLWAFAPVNHRLKARLTFASPMIDPASKTFRCVFTIDNSDHQLPAGFGVRFDLLHSQSYREVAR